MLHLTPSWHQTRLLAAASLAGHAVMAQAAPIYVTPSKISELPTYTDRPIGIQSKLMLNLPPPPVRESVRVVGTPPPESAEPANSLAAVAAAATAELKAVTSGKFSVPSPTAMLRRESLLPLIERAGQLYGVNRALLHAVIDVESAFQPNARSHKGAMGLMQVMPTTAAQYGRFDLTVPVENLEAGARHLRVLLNRYGGDVELALAAYNAGEGAVAKYGNRIPPFAETQAYVKNVLARYRFYRLASHHPTADD